MLNFERPAVILTHESDLDGLVAGLLLQRLARKLYGAEITLEAYHYTGWKMRDLRETAAWATDFSFESRLDRSHWLVIDHHATNTTARYARFIHDTSKSAGSLCYDLCVEAGIGSPKLERLVHLNNVADLFLQDDPDFELAIDYASLVKIYGFWPMAGLVGNDLEKLIDHPLLAVMKVKREIEDPIGFDWAVSHVTEITAGVCLVDAPIGNSNLIIHRMLERKAVPHPVLITALKKGNNHFVVSLRSKDGTALKYAEKLQGGGHPNACGATLPKSVRSISEAVQYMGDLFNPPTRHTKTDSGMEGLLEAFTKAI